MSEEIANPTIETTEVVPVNRMAEIAKGPRLTKKNKKFCQYYTDLSNPQTRWNATQSAIKAGYSEESAGPIAARLISKDIIKAEIARLEGISAAQVSIDKPAFLAMGFELFRGLKQESNKIKMYEVLAKMKGFCEPEKQGSTALFQFINDSSVKTDVITAPKESLESV